MKRDDAVARVRVERLLHESDQMLLWDVLAVDDEPALEEPVPGVLAVRLGDVEQLHVGRVAPHPLREEPGVVVQVPVVEGQSHLPIDPLQRPATLLEHRDGVGRLWRDTGGEGRERLGVRLLRHAVVDLSQEGQPLTLGEGGRGPHQVPPRPLDPSNRPQAAGLAYGHGVRRPGRGEAHARSYLEQVSPGSVQEAPRPESLGLEGLPEKPGQGAQLGGRERAVGGDVEAVLGVDARDGGRDTLPDAVQQRPGGGLGDPGGPVEM